MRSVLRAIGLFIAGVGLLVGAGRALGLTPTDLTTAQKVTMQSQAPVSAIVSCRVTVTENATELKCTNATPPRVRVVKNCDTNTFDVGASGVVSGAGYRYDASEAHVYNVGFNATTGSALHVYGIAPAGTTRVACLEEES